MPVVCSICQDDITEHPQILESAQQLAVCALSCGHCFHDVCVKQWFSSSTGVQGSLVGLCPLCKKPSTLTQALPIFPTVPVREGEASQTPSADLEKKVYELRQERMALELRVKRAETDGIERYNTMCRERTILKGRKTRSSKLVRKLQDECEKFKNLEAEANTRMEKLEKEKDELKAHLEILKAEAKNLIAKYHSVVTGYRMFKTEALQLEAVIL